jgi:hypothetical protein
MTTAVDVLVPDDRVREFQIALGAFANGQTMPVPTPGSAAAKWQVVSLQVNDDRIAAFYASFATWLQAATEQGSPPPAELDPGELTAELFDQLPKMERDFLRLLADDRGRVVGWSELKLKCGLAGPPSLSRALPQFSKQCADRGRSVPVRQELKDDDAVFTLRPELVATVRSFKP